MTRRPQDGLIPRMTPQAFRAAALTLPGATVDIKWGADQVFCVGAKMFAAGGSDGDGPFRFSFKASEIGFEALVEQGVAIPAPYLARAKWVQMASDALPDAEIADLLKQAHAIVAAKLTKKLRAELGIPG